MTFIDWSDPDEMFGLLCEYIADASQDGKSDTARRRFLMDLAAELDELGERFATLPQVETIEILRALLGSQPPEFAGDEALVHVNDCIEELERIRRDRES